MKLHSQQERWIFLAIEVLFGTPQQGTRLHKYTTNNHMFHTAHQGYILACHVLIDSDSSHFCDVGEVYGLYRLSHHQLTLLVN